MVFKKSLPHGGFTWHEDGYVLVLLGKDNVGKNVYVSMHRLLCHIMHGPPTQERFEACHTCDKPHCNTHIKWATKQTNVAESRRVLMAAHKEEDLSKMVPKNIPGISRLSATSEAKRLCTNARRVAPALANQVTRAMVKGLKAKHVGVLRSGKMRPMGSNVMESKSMKQVRDATCNKRTTMRVPRNP